MLHQVQSAANPKISLKTTLNEWHKIRRSLAENRRKRQPQMTCFKHFLG